MIIKVYTSQLDNTPHETIIVSSGSFLDYVKNKIVKFDIKGKHPIHVICQDTYYPAYKWDDLQGDITIHVYPKAKGAAFLLVGAIIASIVVTRLLNPKIKLPSTREITVGDRIESSEIRANIPRLNQVIPEIAGAYRVWLDYLSVPVKRFVNKRFFNFVSLFSVGVGDFEIDQNKIKIGETPLSALVDNAVQVAVYDSVTNVANEYADIYYISKEVGQSSSGNQGLELVSPDNFETGWGDDWYDYGTLGVLPQRSPRIKSKNSIQVPQGWASGDILRVIAPVDRNIDSQKRITGNINELQAFIGMIIELDGDLDGIFRVTGVDQGGARIAIEYLDGSPFDPDQGTYKLAIGYAGLRYQISSKVGAQVDVIRLTDTGAQDPVWLGFVPSSVPNSTVSIFSDNKVSDYIGAFYACPQTEVTNKIELDFFFPSGLAKIEEDGALTPYNVRVEVQYRDSALAGAWSTIIYPYTEATLDQIGFTETINLPAAYRPEVRCRRIGARSTSTSVQDTVLWYGLRSRLSIKNEYNGITKIGIKIDNLSRLGVQSENQISAEVIRKLNGVATRKITDWVKYVGSTIGYNNAQYDNTELARLQAIWDSRGDTYDYAEASESTIKTTMNQALAVGFAELTINKGLISPIRDEVRTVYEQMYSNQNLIQPIRKSFSAVKNDDIDGVDVEYIDESSWTQETVQVRLAGDLGIKSRKIRINGVTNRTRAWRIGMRVRRAEKYRRWSYKFSTELDGLNSKYFSYCVLSDDVATYSQSGQIFNVTNLGNNLYELDISEPFDVISGDKVFAYRLPDGKFSGVYTAVPTVDKFKIRGVIPTNPPVINSSQELPQIIFGKQDKLFYPVLITKITPRGFEAVDLEATNYDARVYADDDNSP